MVRSKNELEIIEAKISKSLNNERLEKEDSVIEKIKSDSKISYKYAKSYSKTNEGIGPLMDEKGNIITENKSMADLLAKQYRLVFSKPLESYNYEHINYNAFLTMEDVIFSKEKIKKQISKLKNCCSSGPDGICSRCYKFGGELLLDALSDIYQRMWEEEYSPQQTREAWISPIWKGDNKLLPANYRPIALSNHLSKIFEGILREAIIEHLDLMGIYDPTQHGSLKGKSTTSQLLTQLDTILDMAKNGSNVEIIYLDFSKAYDKIDIKIALQKC